MTTVRFKIAELAAERGIDVNELERCGFSHSTAWRLLNEDSDKLSLATLSKLCVAFECTIDDLIGIKKPEKVIHWRVRELAEQKGFNIRKLALATGSTTANMWRLWHDEVSAVHLSTVDRLVAALDCTPGDLFEMIESE